ncbi:unnamed protein product [Clonostachys rosea]|uniref:Xylanolytic transcriptional activator regulatory domain-containing protein n=1 Tax=Bionectria ochroleuca TaxID=29856 RepID=A0ABY6TPD2_BIOOC|nr:unnamed protein product [Clonostachys rosea]
MDEDVGGETLLVQHSIYIKYDADGWKSLGDASVHGFLQKVSRHLAQIGQGLPRNLFNKYEESDVATDTSYVTTMVLPDKAMATAYSNAYFDHGNATCRYLPRDEIFRLLDELYTTGSRILQNHTEMAIILLVLGTGYENSEKNKDSGLLIADSYWQLCVSVCLFAQSVDSSAQTFKRLPFLHAAESRLLKVGKMFPPSLGGLQAQVLKCQCELLLGRFNSAWMSLGWAVRLGQMIDFQKEPTVLLNQLDAFHKRRVFWAMFMIDRYLAVILGRPMVINEKDITVTLSSEINRTISSLIDSREKKLIVGTTAHYRLTRIIGKAASQLYPAANRDPTAIEQIVFELEREMSDWLETTPKFFHPMESSTDDAQEQLFDVPWILKRQQRTVQAAFYFTNMLIYRGYLLWDFLRQEPSQFHSEPPTERVIKCVDSALSMIRLSANFEVDEGKYNGTFWITSHFVFSAISILVVYLTLCQDSEDRSKIEQAVEDAMRFHRKLDNTANISAQRLLDESRSRAQIVQHIKTPTSSTRQDPEPECFPTSTMMPEDGWIGVSDPGHVRKATADGSVDPTDSD